MNEKLMAMLKFQRVKRLVEENCKDIEDLDDAVVMSYICMLIEEVCKRRGYDASQVASDIATAVKEVNEICGKY